MQLVKTQAEHICHVAAHLRTADAEEARLWDGSTPAGAVLNSVRSSQVVNTVVIGGEAAGLCGVNRGRVWLLGTPRLTASAREVRASVRLTRQWLEAQRARFGRLHNFVWAGHAEAVRWLQWLGGTLEAARPLGLARAAFHPFHFAT